MSDLTDPSINSGYDIWHDRRVNIGYETAEELAKHYNLLNWRGHPEAQRDATEESLDALGYVGAIKKSIQSGVILDGHLRIEIALAKDPSIKLPVDYYDLSPDEEALALQVLDATTEMAEPIADKLADLLARTRELTADRPGLGAMLQKLKERAGINGHQATKDEPPKVNKSQELQERWGTALGQVWEIPSLINGRPHRIVCGDCTDKAAIGELLQGAQMALVATDPPYNVGIEYGETVDDNKIQEIYESFSVSWFRPWQAVSDRQVVTPGYNNLACWSRLFEKPYHIGTWTKTNSMTRGHVSRFACYEPVLFYGSGWKRERHNDIFDYPVSEQSFDTGEKLTSYHPCPKPLKMWLDLIENYSEQGDLIGDAFLGSGTALIAAHQLGRVVHATEIDPGYCGVALERAMAMGLSPKLISEL